MSYYRIQQGTDPVEWLLDPEYQYSTSWNATEDVRRGVSVCASVEDLAEYFAQAGVPLDDDCLLVEVDGPWSDDEDQDAHLGAMLVFPERIVSIESVTDRFYDLVSAAYDEMMA